MENLQTPLSKNQLELLAMFNNRGVTDEEWGQIREIIANFFAEKSLMCIYSFEKLFGVYLHLLCCS